MTAVLSAAVLVLVLLHFLTPWMPSAVAERLHLNSEASLPAWFSSSLLMAVSLGALLVVLRAARHQDKALAWRALCGGYAFLSADEACRIHELFDLMTPVKWVLVYGPAAFTYVCYVAWRMENESKRTLTLVLGGMAVFGAGGLGLEALSALLYPLPEPWQEIEYAAEEGLEMLGSIMVLAGVLHKLGVQQQQSPAEQPSATDDNSISFTPSVATSNERGAPCLK